MPDACSLNRFHSLSRNGDTASRRIFFVALFAIATSPCCSFKRHTYRLIVLRARDNHAQPESRVPQSASVVAKPCSPANKRRRNQPRDYENCKLLCACAGQSECHCKQHTREHVSRCPSKC